VNNKQILLDPLFEPVLFEAFLCSGLCEFEPAASCSFRAALGLLFGKKCTGQNCGQNRGKNQNLCTVTKKRPFFKVFSLKNGRFLVEVTGLEPAASWSQRNIYRFFA